MQDLLEASENLVEALFIREKYMKQSLQAVFPTTARFLRMVRSWNYILHLLEKQHSLEIETCNLLTGIYLSHPITHVGTKQFTPNFQHTDVAH